MTNEFFHFMIGDYRCTLVAEGTHAYDDPAGLLFPDAPATELAGELAALGVDSGNWPTWVSPYTCLLIDTGCQRILVDTGAGDMLPEAGSLGIHLRAAGIDPASVDQVLLSHAHPDHSGGTGLFPNARILMSRTEWRFWTENPKLPRLPGPFEEMLTSMVSTLLAPLGQRIELVDGSTEIAPGIRFVDAPGHTPGHMAVHVTRGEQQLIYAGDAVIHPLHVRHPDWSPLVDVLPTQAILARNTLLAMAARESAVFVGFHLPGLGAITRSGRGFERVRCECRFSPARGN